jgi:hypothetical protein
VREFRLGERVRHPRFGEGKIVGWRDGLLAVRFPEGERHFAPRPVADLEEYRRNRKPPTDPRQRHQERLCRPSLPCSDPRYQPAAPKS